jgi:hypothetical protein
MKITVEYQGYPNDNLPKIAVYERKEGEPWIDSEWDFLFEQLKEYRDHLKLRVKHEESLGKQIVIQAKIDKLEKLFNKYIDFIQMAEEGRYDL